MTSSRAVNLGCLAAMTMAISLQAVSAARFSPAEQPLGSIAPLVLSNADLSGGASKGYRPWFENGSWQGDLVEYSVTKDGGLSTSIKFSELSPVDNGSKLNWSALVEFAATDEATYWDTGRKIITWNGSKQMPFRFTDAALGVTNKAKLDSPAGQGLQFLNFVRGDRSNEDPNGGKLRKRTSILGDIIHSKPVYVAAPNDTRTEPGYAKFVEDNKNRASRVYVGANDGMLHVFDANGEGKGKEVYAYIPSMLIEKLPLLTKRPYVHTYFVDGEMSVRDAQIDGVWRTVLAGSLGAGGRGFFILDITDPDLSSESSDTAKDTKVLFEYSLADDPNDLGDSFSRPVIAELNDGKWYVVVGNGYNSENGVAKLYLVNLDTFEVTTIPTASGTPGNPNPNGLSSPSLLDADRNGTADYAYAGDIDGNLWKFNLSAGTASEWESTPPLLLHPTAGNQAIVHAPQITLHPQYGYLVHFATGRLFTTADLTDTSVQSLYGIWDSGKAPPSNAANQKLLAQTWDGPKTYNYTTEEDGPATQTIAIYNPDSDVTDWKNYDGWKVDFPAGGYRVLQPVQVRANRVKATVYKPVEGQQGENWLVEAVLQDGGANPITRPIYDLNVDRDLDNDDLYVENGQKNVPMMWRQVDGIMSQVTIATIASGEDVLFINFLQPNPVPCSVDCKDYIPAVSLDGVPVDPGVCPLCAGQIPLPAPGGSTGAGQNQDGGDGSITEGNTFKPGRVSWTDIVK